MTTTTTTASTFFREREINLSIVPESSFFFSRDVTSRDLFPFCFVYVFFLRKSCHAKNCRRLAGVFGPLILGNFLLEFSTGKKLRKIYTGG
jgi:hypothetical protein